MLKQEQLYIKGMTCINCQNRIEDALKKNAGVTDVWVSYEEGIASVSYQTETTTTEELANSMLFVIGLITSIHCIAMCGGINLSQTLQKTEDKEVARTMLKNTFVYNTGRVISYTIIGGVLGAVGGLAGMGTGLQTSSLFQGILKLLAGLLMVLMGMNIKSSKK